jgi:hypothetical protein
MFAVPVKRETRPSGPIGVLLGGSGRARMFTACKPPVAALLRARLLGSEPAEPVRETCAEAI